MENGTHRFKSLDDYAEYVKEKELVEKKKEPTLPGKTKKATVVKFITPNKNEGQTSYGATTGKKKIRKPKVSSAAFPYYRGLSVKEKRKWLTQRGVKSFIVKGIYNRNKRKIYTKVINPFTGERIEFDYYDTNLENGRGLQVTLITIPLPKNRNVLFDFSIYNPEYRKQVKDDGLNSKNKTGKKKNNPKKRPNSDIPLVKKPEAFEEAGCCDYSTIHFDDFVTTTDSNSCTKNKHDIEEIDAVVFILRKSGKIIEKIVPASYCRTCKRYYISRWQYENICELGTPLWQNISEYGRHHAETHSYYDELNAESILHRSGYNVGSEDDLTAEQRHTILTLLVESKLCDKHKIVSHLTWLINSRQGNKSMQNAVGKWKEDRNFIDAYHLGTHRIVGISVIRHRV